MNVMFVKNNIANSANAPRLNECLQSSIRHDFPNKSDVARMSGMPQSVVSRAEAILANLEKVYGSGEIVPSTSLKQRTKRRAVAESAVETKDNIQLSMFQLDDPVLKSIRDEIKGLDINSLTPLEALNKLNEIKKLAGI